MSYLRNIEKMLNPISEEQGATAAIAIILNIFSEDFEVLFVKRAQSSKDLWSGQIAFPGGKRDNRDENLIQTIIRETFEETNIDLINHGRFLGVMDAVRSTQRPDMKVLPFLVLLESEPKIKLNEKELVDYFWISIKGLIQRRGTIGLNFRRLPAYDMGNFTIWGLTYRILEKFISLVNL